MRKCIDRKKIAPLAQRRIILIVICVLVGCVAGYLLLTRESPPTAPEAEPIKVGENQTYGLYSGGTKIGTLSWEVNNIENYSGVVCYSATYVLSVGNAARGGQMRFDNNGILRYARVAVAENDNLKWATTVTYFPESSRMHVFIDNREYNQTLEGYEDMQQETMMPEHLWYKLRLERLYVGYARSFDFNAIPRAFDTSQGSVKVTREERIYTEAGVFDCYVVECTGAYNATMWVSKDRTLVPKLAESNYAYLLENCR